MSINKSNVVTLHPSQQSELITLALNCRADEVFFLTKADPINLIPDGDIQRVLTVWSGSSWVYRHAALMIAAAFTEGKCTFALTRASHNALAKDNKLGELNGARFALFRGEMLRKGILNEDAPYVQPVKNAQGRKDGLAGIYSIKHQELVQSFDNIWSEEHRTEQAIEVNAKGSVILGQIKSDHPCDHPCDQAYDHPCDHQVPSSQFQGPSNKYQVSSTKLQVTNNKYQGSSNNLQDSNTNIQVPSGLNPQLDISLEYPENNFKNDEVDTFKSLDSSFEINVEVPKSNAEAAKLSTTFPDIFIPSVPNGSSSSNPQSGKVKAAVFPIQGKADGTSAASLSEWALVEAELKYRVKRGNSIFTALGMHKRLLSKFSEDDLKRFIPNTLENIRIECGIPPEDTSEVLIAAIEFRRRATVLDGLRNNTVGADAFLGNVMYCIRYEEWGYGLELTRAIADTYQTTPGFEDVLGTAYSAIKAVPQDKWTEDNDIITLSDKLELYIYVLGKKFKCESIT